MTGSLRSLAVSRSADGSCDSAQMHMKQNHSLSHPAAITGLHVTVKWPNSIYNSVYFGISILLACSKITFNSVQLYLSPCFKVVDNSYILLTEALEGRSTTCFTFFVSLSSLKESADLRLNSMSLCNIKPTIRCSKCKIGTLQGACCLHAVPLVYNGSHFACFSGDNQQKSGE